MVCYREDGLPVKQPYINVEELKLTTDIEHNKPKPIPTRVIKETYEPVNSVAEFFIILVMVSILIFGFMFLVK